jgi:hypothetical protein
MYRTLLQAAFFHSTRPHLPDDDAQLWLLAGCESPKQWERNKEAVRAMFTTVDVNGVSLLSQKRLLADWDRLEEKRQMLSENGRRGRKAQLESSNRPANAGQLPGICLADAGQEKLREVKRKEEKNTQAPETGAPVIQLPDWLPLETWNAFLEMRKKARKELKTAYAIKLAIKELEKLRAAGNDPKAVLEQSILKNYPGLYELSKGGSANGHSRPSGAVQSDRQSAFQPDRTLEL